MLNLVKNEYKNLVTIMQMVYDEQHTQVVMDAVHKHQ